MRVRTWAWVLITLTGIAAFPAAAQEEHEAVGKLLEKQFAKGEVKYDYLLYLPPDYGKEDKAVPLVLFLHGKGDKLDRMKRFGLPRQIESKKDVPFILVAPESPGGGWSPRSLAALLDEIEGKYKVDRDRVYVTGLSMGGFGTWTLVAAYPERFAAAVPICGGGSPRSAAKLKDLPIWAFHGAKDEVVPASRTEAMVQALKDAGSDRVRFTLYPDAGHNAWSATYSNPEVWEWLLKQRRAAGASPGAGKSSP